MGGFYEYFQQWLQQNGQGQGQGPISGMFDPNSIQNNAKYDQVSSEKNSGYNLQNMRQSADNAAADRQFAMGMGLSANHDQFQAPMQMGEMASMAKAFTPQRPFRDDMPIGFGARYIQQLLGGG